MGRMRRMRPTRRVRRTPRAHAAPRRGRLVPRAGRAGRAHEPAARRRTRTVARDARIARRARSRRAVAPSQPERVELRGRERCAERVDPDRRGPRIELRDEPRVAREPCGHVADQHGVRACVRVDDRQRCGEFAHARHRARRGAVLLEPAAQSRREPGQHRIVAVAIAAHDAIGRRACAQPERARLGAHARLRGLVERARGGKHERDIARRAGDARDPRRVVIAGPPARVDDPLPRERRAQLGERRVIEPHRRVLERVGRDELQHRAVVVRHEPAGAREPLDEAPRRQRLAHVEPARRARVDVDGDARAAAQLAQCIGGVHRADAIVETRERPRERHRPQRRRMARERERDGGSRCGRAPRHDARSAVSASAPRFRR